MAKLLKKTVKTSLGTIVAGQPLPDKLPKKEADHIRKRGLLGDTEVTGRAKDDEKSSRIAELEAANAGLKAEIAELTAKLEAADAEIADLKAKLEAVEATAAEEKKPAE